MSADHAIKACRWKIPEVSLLHCINWAVISGELPLVDGQRWRLKRPETEAERRIDPKFVLVTDSSTSIQPAGCLIELGIRAGCLEDRGQQNLRYELISCGEKFDM